MLHQRLILNNIEMEIQTFITSTSIFRQIVVRWTFSFVTIFYIQIIYLYFFISTKSEETNITKKINYNKNSFQMVRFKLIYYIL